MGVERVLVFQEGINVATCWNWTHSLKEQQPAFLWPTGTQPSLNVNVFSMKNPEVLILCSQSTQTLIYWRLIKLSIWPTEILQQHAVGIRGSKDQGSKSSSLLPAKGELQTYSHGRRWQNVDPLYMCNRKCHWQLLNAGQLYGSATKH